ncbi:MAG: rod shape-determining protein MreD [Methylophilaceae bacterium]|nr:rod shape-determining protein MreD [Methylophilaceae bacterium]
MRPVSGSQIFASLTGALLLYLLPWAGFGLMLRPDFVLLVLIYWLMRAPHMCNIGTAWLMGLLVDLANGDLFGQHALAYVLVAFLAVHYQKRTTLFNQWQQGGYVFLLLLISQIVLLMLELFGGADVPGWDYFLPSVVGVLSWQLVVYSKIKVTGEQEA